MIRCAAILQLLLGNMGRPGGGILALRGHASIQGSTDVPTLFDILPGYLSMPKFGEESKTLAKYIEKNGARTGWWKNYDKYIVSFLKAYYGDAAQPENSFGFDWLPRVTGDHSHQGYWLDMMDGKMDGLFVDGPESRGRWSKLRDGTPRARQAEVDGRPRNGRDRNGLVLV